MIIIAQAGMDPMRFADSEDPDERKLMIHIAERVRGRRELETRSLAVEIANKIWSAVKIK